MGEVQRTPEGVVSSYRIVDLGWKGDADLDMVLTNLRKAIEA